MSLNKVILIGNVGRDPDVRYFDNGAAVANFPLATSERGYTLANGTVIPAYGMAQCGRPPRSGLLCGEMGEERFRALCGGQDPYT